MSPYPSLKDYSEFVWGGVRAFQSVCTWQHCCNNGTIFSGQHIFYYCIISIFKKFRIFSCLWKLYYVVALSLVARLKNCRVPSSASDSQHRLMRRDNLRSWFGWPRFDRKRNVACSGGGLQLLPCMLLLPFLATFVCLFRVG